MNSRSGRNAKERTEAVSERAAEKKASMRSVTPWLQTDILSPIWPWGNGRHCPVYPSNGSFYGTGTMDVPSDRPQKQGNVYLRWCYNAAHDYRFDSDSWVDSRPDLGVLCQKLFEIHRLGYDLDNAYSLLHRCRTFDPIEVYWRRTYADTGVRFRPYGGCLYVTYSILVGPCAAYDSGR